MIMQPITIEIVGAVFAVAGTILLALKGSRAGWGFVAYLVSNVAWIFAAWTQGQWPLLTQNLVFLASSCLGIWVWLLQPRLPVFRSVYRASRPYRGRFQSVRLALRCCR